MRLFTILALLLLCCGAPLPASAIDSATCFQCHDRQGFTGRVRHQPVAGGRCQDCHLPHASRYAGLLTQPQRQLCLSCHQPVARRLDLAHVHRPVAQGQCTACHAPHAGDRHLLRGNLASLCASCHPPPEGGRRHRPFADGNCTACHDPHGADNRLLLRKQGDSLCLGCHPGAAGKHRRGPRPKNCLSCHQPHTSPQRHLLRPVLHPPFTEGCATCHQAGTEPSAASCLTCHQEVMAAVALLRTHLTSREGNVCTRCHDPHAGDDHRLLRGDETDVCTSCHTDVIDRYQDHASVHPRKAAGCSDCHEAHGSNRLAMLRDDGAAVCARCHETQGKFTHPVGPKVRDPRNGQPVTCLTCHDPKGADYQFQLLADPSRELCVQCHHY